MQQKTDMQHVYLVGAKSLGANGDGCMDENKFDGVTKINDHKFELHNAHCFKIDVPQIGPMQAIYYDVAALDVYKRQDHIYIHIFSQFNFLGDNRIFRISSLLYQNHTFCLSQLSACRCTFHQIPLTYDLCLWKCCLDVYKRQPF